MSDLKLWENTYYSLEDRLVIAGSEITRLSKRIAELEARWKQFEEYDCDELKAANALIDKHCARIAELETQLEVLRKQKPVAWRDLKTNTFYWHYYANTVPLYAAPIPPEPVRKDLVLVPRELIDAAKNLIAVKGRHHTELAYKQLCQALVNCEGIKP